MIEDLLQNKKLILVCGSGGVGKTTMAATLAFKGALLGKKVIVLTIDPARRLATSLGLDKLTFKPMKISANLLEKVSGEKGINLSAMMLDTKRTFDQLVVKYSPNKEVEKKILKNKIYQHLSDMIAGSQEYMAMEKLYEIATEEEFDLVVIDTPPTTHAIDFLEAPQRMIDAISHSMIHLLLKPAMRIGESGLKLFAKGSQMILKVFDRITGFAFLQDISEMLFSFQGLLSGFENRASEVKKILTDEMTSFVMVCACEEKSVEETHFFSEKLSDLNLNLSGVILNRVHPLYSIPAAQREKDLAELSHLIDDETAEKMITSFESFSGKAKRDAAYKKEIAGELEKDQFLSSVPLFESDIHDLEGLFRLSKCL